MRASVFQVRTQLARLRKEMVPARLVGSFALSAVAKNPVLANLRKLLIAREHPGPKIWVGKYSLFYSSANNRATTTPKARLENHCARAGLD